MHAIQCHSSVMFRPDALSAMNLGVHRPASICGEQQSFSMMKLEYSIGNASVGLTCKKRESIACLGVQGVAENDQTAYEDDGEGNGAPEPPVLLQLLLEALEA